MNGKHKKILSILLIIAMVMTSAGFGTFADSIDDVVTASSKEEKSSSKFYGEVSTDGSDSTKTFDESTTVVDEEPEEDETTTVEEPKEDELTTVEEPEEDETTTTEESKEDETTTAEEPKESATSNTEESSEDESTSVTEKEGESTTKVEVEETTTDEGNDTTDTASNSTLDKPLKLSMNFEEMPVTTAPLFGSGVPSDIYWILTPGDWVSGYVASTSYIEGEALTLPGVDKLEVPAHYRFNGWKIDDTIVTEIPDTQVGDVYVVADFERITHDIHWTLTPGDWASGYVASTSYLEGETLTLPGVDKLEVPAHYRFNGWKMGTGTTYVTEIPDTEIDEVYIVADFEKITHNITWHLNNNNQGWIAGFVATTSYIEGEVFTLYATISVVQIAGHYLDHWEINGAPATVIPATFTTDVDIYAIWEERTYSIEYYENYSSTIARKIATRSYSEAYNLDLQPDWTVEGYKFICWLDKDTDDVVTGVLANTTYNLKVYSMWILDDARDYPLPTDVGTIETLSAYWFSDGTYNPDYTRSGGTKRYTITELSFIKGDEHLKPKESLESWNIVMKSGGRSHCIAYITEANKVVIWIPPNITPMLATKEMKSIRSGGKFIAWTSWFGAGYQTYRGWERIDSASWPHIAMDSLQHIYGLNHVLFHDLHIAFSNCYALKDISLISFFTSGVNDLSRTFNYCNSLQTIYCDLDLKAMLVAKGFDNTFTGCTVLRGENGTAYNSSKIDGTYAKLDEPGNPGYFTSPQICNVRYYTSGIVTPPDTKTYFKDDTVQLSTYSDLDIYGAKFLRWEDASGTVYDNSNIEILRLSTDLNLYGVWEEYEKELDKNWYDSIGIDKSSIRKINIVRYKPIAYAASYQLDSSNGITAYLDGDTLYINVQVLNGSVVKNAYLPTDVERMFGDFDNLEEINGLEVMTSSISNASRMFENCDKLQSVTLPDKFANEIEDASYMFNNCTNLTNITIDSDFNKAENLSHMFANCESLTSIDLTRMATDSVTNMESTFENCKNLSVITVPDGLGSNATSMKNLFATCSNLTTINLPENFGHSATDMSEMFKDCENLTSVNVSNIDTSNATDLSSMFENCADIEEISFDNLDTTNLLNVNNMFKGCNNLATISVPASFTGMPAGVTSDDMFKDCENLKGGQGYKFNPNYIDSTYARVDFGGIMPGYFSAQDDSVYSSVDFHLRNDWDSSIAKNNIKKIKFYNGDIATSGYSEFYLNVADGTKGYVDGDELLIHIGEKVGRLKADNDMSSYFGDFGLVEEIEGLSLIDTSVATVAEDLFKGNNNLQSIDLPDGFLSNATNMKGLFASCSEVTSIVLPVGFAQSATNMAEMFKDCRNLTNITINSDLENVTNLSHMFDNCENIQNVDLRKISTVSVTNIDSMFENCVNLNNIIVLDGFGSNIVNASKVFYNCRQMNAINLGNFSLENVENIESIFEGCENLRVVIGENIATFSNLQTSKKAFKGCSSLVAFSFDIFDTPVLTNTEEMFAGCTNLRTILINENFTGLTTLTNTDNMFLDCINLVGGQGFAYDPNATNGDFARIDYGGIMPGYYTLDNPAKYEEIQFTVPIDWFHSLTKNKSDITEIRFFNDAPPVGGGSAIGAYDEMFYINQSYNNTRAFIENTADGSIVKFHYGHSISKLKIDGDASGFFKDFTSLKVVEGLEDKVDVTNVTDISELFSGCTSLEVARLNPNTENVTEMDKVFYGCENLREVHIGSNLKLNKVTNLESAFEGCKKLTTLDMGIASFSSVQNLKNAFKDCESLPLFSFDICDTPTLATTSGMFSGCKNLRKIYVNDNFQGLQHIAYDNMFDGCVNLIGGEGFTYSPTVPACKSGEFARVDYGGIMPGYYTIFNKEKYHDVVFDLATDWYKSTTLPKEEVRKIKFFNTPQSEGGMGAYDEMFYMSNADKTRVYVEASTKTIKFHYGHDIDTLKFQGDVEGMFAGFINLEEMEGIENLDASRIANMSAMFAGCKNMKHLTIPNGLINVTTLSEAFKDCSSLETVVFGSNVEVKNVTTLDGLFENCTSLKSIDFGTSFDISKVTTMERMFKNCESLTEIKLNQTISTGNIESMREMFMGCTNLTSEGLVMPLASLDVRNVKDMGYMFASCSNISTINLTGIEANKLDTMEYMFANCESLENIKFGSTFDTSTVTNMSHMFEGCKKLKGTPTSELEPSENNTNSNNVKSFIARLFGNGEEETPTASESNILLDLSDVDTSNVTNMSAMFKDCDNITILDLYNFNTEKVEDMSSMFEKCSELKCIISPDFATASVTNSANMFAGCNNLVGGEGTKWIDTKVLDKEYAVVDEGPESSKKGYFTWDAYITYNGGGSVSGTMEREAVRRYRKHTLKHNEFRLNNYTFAGWKDDDGNRYKDEAEIAEVSKSINLTAMWTRNGRGGGPGGGGGRGGGNGGGIMQDLDRSVNFIMQTPIYEHEYAWIYDNQGRRVGVNLSVDSMVGKAMLKSVRTKGAYGLNQDGKTMQLGGGGIYKVYYRGKEEWFGFDKYNKMMTGFVETSTKTRMLTVATDIVTALVNTESIDADKIFIETTGQVGKYYLYEQEGDLRGQLWNQPIVVNGIQYTFDLIGKVISSTDTPIDQGIWEYNPLEDHWKYFVPDTDGKARYYTDTSFDVYYQGETYKYIFDSNGYLLTGYFNWRGKDYYGLESGQFKGAATEITKK